MKKLKLSFWGFSVINCLVSYYRNFVTVATNMQDLKTQIWVTVSVCRVLQRHVTAFMYSLSIDLRKINFFLLEPKKKVQRETKEGRIWGRRKRRFRGCWKGVSAGSRDAEIALGGCAEQPLWGCSAWEGSAVLTPRGLETRQQQRVRIFRHRRGNTEQSEVIVLHRNIKTRAPWNTSTLSSVLNRSCWGNHFPFWFMRWYRKIGRQ